MPRSPTKIICGLRTPKKLSHFPRAAVIHNLIIQLSGLLNASVLGSFLVERNVKTFHLSHVSLKTCKCSKINYMFNWIAISSFLLEVPMNKNLIKRNRKKSAGPAGVVATGSLSMLGCTTCVTEKGFYEKNVFFS